VDLERVGYPFPVFSQLLSPIHPILLTSWHTLLSR
jgi:hypothetical protein